MPKLLLLLLLFLVAGLASSGVTAAFGWGSAPAAPSESECRPYIEKALKELSADTTSQEAVDTTSGPETPQTTDTSKEDSKEEGSIEGKDDSTTIESQEKDEGDKSGEEVGKESGESGEAEKSIEGGETSAEDVSADEKSAEDVSAGEEKSAEDKAVEEVSAETQEDKSGETEEAKSEEKEAKSEEEEEEEAKSEEDTKSGETEEAKSGETEEAKSGEIEEAQSGEEEGTSVEAEGKSEEAEEGKSEEAEGKSEEVEGKSAETGEKSSEDISGEKEGKSAEEAEGTSAEADVGKEEESKEESGEHEDGPVKRSAEGTGEESAEKEPSDEKQEAETASKEDVTEEQTDDKSSETEEKSPEEKEQSAEEEPTSREESKEVTDASSNEAVGTEVSEEQASVEATASEENSAEGEDKLAEGVVQDEASKESEEVATESGETAAKEESGETAEEKDEGEKSEEREEGSSKEEVKVESEEATEDKSTESVEKTSEEEKNEEAETKEEVESEESAAPEEELTMEIYIPEKLRSRDHIGQILKLDEDSAETEKLLSKTSDITLRDLKRLYDSAIKPLEVLYKYRDLSNRHFGDPEIFSKPLVLFMGPWSGGKSTIINYLLDIEYKASALRTGAEPSPAYFNILMYGDEEEVLDGTQLAADWTFSGLQKFGQGLLDRLRGLKLNHPLLEKVNIVEIPGILEIRKQVERLFPFNDACQWFIDRADIIFLVYDPSKLDVGPETEAILDQLKGREYQTRIILNKADQVKPEELMRVQGTLIWNISPLMSSAEPPIMYSTSLWSLPYEKGAPTRLLHAQERAFLQDLRSAVDKRVENKISSARRFAVRVRNHAKMVDCYLTTYYNHKSFFGNRKKVADDIIEHPQNYHIYEGLSTLTNISRYDLPDPEVYRDFFRLNPLYDFQQLSATCTYFRGCPINRLDVAIAYELPELVGKYKKNAESVTASNAGTGTPPKS